MRPRQSRLRAVLGDRGDDKGGDALFLCPHGDLGRDARLGGVGHADVGGNLAAVDGLAEELERVCRLVDGYVGTLDWLQRENLGELLGSLCNTSSLVCQPHKLEKLGSDCFGSRKGGGNE